MPKLRTLLMILVAFALAFFVTLNTSFAAEPERPVASAVVAAPESAPLLGADCAHGNHPHYGFETTWYYYEGHEDQWAHNGVQWFLAHYHYGSWSTYNPYGYVLNSGSYYVRC